MKGVNKYRFSSRDMLTEKQKDIVIKMFESDLREKTVDGYEYRVSAINPNGRIYINVSGDFDGSGVPRSWTRLYAVIVLDKKFCRIDPTKFLVRTYHRI
jgi:hypothetical protein